MPSLDTSHGFVPPSDRLTQRQYAAIGRVAALWAEVEWAMERMLTRLALVPSLLGYILTDKLGPDNRIGAIYSLINVHKVKYAGLLEAALLIEIEEYLPALSAMKGDRNYIVHSVWSNAGDTFLSHYDISATARSGFDIEGGPCQRLEPIEAFGEEVQKAATLLWNLGARIPKLDAALLEKSDALALGSRRRPGIAAMRQLQPKSFARLQRKAPKPPAPPKGNKKAKRA